MSASTQSSLPRINFFAFCSILWQSNGLLIITQGFDTDPTRCAHAILLANNIKTNILLIGLTLRFLSVVLYIFFYGAFESITGGKTPGKYLTGTRAVKPDGTRITWDVAFTRSLSRIVPFEPFSALGSPADHYRCTHYCVLPAISPRNSL
jgi:RDD family